MTKFFGLCLLTFGLLVSWAHAAEQAAPAATLVGIGATLEMSPDGAARVMALIPNAPAQRAGLMAGDLIVAVRSLPGESVIDVHGLTLGEIVALIRGPVGVPAELFLMRGDSVTETLVIVREEFEVGDD